MEQIYNINSHINIFNFEIKKFEISRATYSTTSKWKN